MCTHILLKQGLSFLKHGAPFYVSNRLLTQFGRLSQAELIKRPDGIIEVGGKAYPQYIWSEEPCGSLGDFLEYQNSENNGSPQKHNNRQCVTDRLSAEKYW